jgi:hypothetical protein
LSALKRCHKKEREEFESIYFFYRSKATNRHPLQAYLRIDGFSIDHHALDPADGLEFASQMKYEIAIADLCREIRSITAKCDSCSFLRYQARPCGSL